MEMYLFARLEGMIFFIFLIGGEMMRFLFVSFKLIYSSKYSRSSLVLVGTFTLLVSILEMLRRMVRDHQFRNHGAVGTIADWPKVRAGEDKNIFPYNGEADILFNSYHVYEIAVLKKYATQIGRASCRERV